MVLDQQVPARRNRLEEPAPRTVFASTSGAFVEFFFAVSSGTSLTKPANRKLAKGGSGLFILRFTFLRRATIDAFRMTSLRPLHAARKCSVGRKTACWKMICWCAFLIVLDDACPKTARWRLYCTWCHAYSSKPSGRDNSTHRQIKGEGEGGSSGYLTNSSRQELSKDSLWSPKRQRKKRRFNHHWHRS